MGSLTETAYHTRRAINWGILAVVFYFILRFTWTLFVALWLFLFPPQPAPANHAFGKLPPLSFPAPESSPAAQLTFTLETITGSLPEASDAARVYFMPKAAADLLAISKTQEFAKRLLFDQTPIQETRTVYRFNDIEYPLRKLRYDIVSDNFILRYGYEQDTGLFTEGVLRDVPKIEDEAIELLKKNFLYHNDYEAGTYKTSFFKLVGNALIPVTNLSQTDAMRVDFFRRPVNAFKVVTPNPDDGQVQIMFSGSVTLKKHLLELTYTHWPIDYQTFATYDLKPVDQAWQELQNGSGYIAKYPINGEAKAVVRTVLLGYYDSFDPQTYLQPVYVFEGDYGFTAYVPAIAPEWVE